MRERPILFSAPMVRALLNGTKTQTRRVVKPAALDVVQFIGADDRPTGDFGLCLESERVISKHVRCPYGVPGDLLWVREEFSGPWRVRDLPPRDWKPGEWPEARPIWFWADGEPVEGDWTKPKPSIHMPRWLSRITLRITDVRVERLNEISEADAEAEGIREPSLGDEVWFGFLGLPRATCPAKTAFAGLWADVNGAQSWAANPWVWVVTFERVTP